MVYPDSESGFPLNTQSVAYPNDSSRKWSFRRGVEDVDLTGPGNRTPMADRVGLGRFSFAVVRCAVHLVSGLATQPVARVPEIGRARLIRDIPEHGTDFSIPDFPKRLAAKLEIVSLLIDRPTAVAINQDALLHFGHQVFQRNTFGGGFERHIGHAWKGYAAPTVRVQTPIRPLVPDQGRQLARGLPINKHAFLNQVPALCRHALVVVTDRRQSL